MTQFSGAGMKGKHWLFYAAVFFCFLGLYAATAQRGVSWQDSGGFQCSVLTGSHTSLGGGGLAVVHPWYLVFARLFVLCFPDTMRVYAVNLFSGLGLATAVLLAFVLVRQITGKTIAAIVSAVTLGFAQMAWWLGTLAEVYTWSLAFLIAEILCLLHICRAEKESGCRGWWLILAAVNGVHASVHNVALLNLPVYSFLWVKQNRSYVFCLWPSIKLVVGCAFMWCVGATLLIRLLLNDMQESQSFIVSLRSLLVGNTFAPAVMGTKSVNVPVAISNFAIAGVSFASPCWVLIFWAKKKWETDRQFKTILLTLTLVQSVFWVRYFVPDQATFLLPTLGLLVLWLGIGVAGFLAEPGKKKKLLILSLAGMGVVCQVFVPCVLARAVGPHISRSRSLPFRDESRYWLVPWKHNEKSAEQFVRAVDTQLTMDDMLISDLTTSNPIQAARIAGISRGRWRLISAWSKETEDETLEAVTHTLHRGGRVFVVSPVAGYTSTKLLSEFEFEQKGVLWQVKGDQ